MHTVDPVSPLTTSKTHFPLWWIWTSPKVALELEFMNPFPQCDVISLGMADLEELSSTGSHMYAKLWSGIIKPTLSVSSWRREKDIWQGRRGKRERERDGRGDKEKEGKKKWKQGFAGRRGGGGNRQEWRVIMSTLWCSWCKVLEYFKLDFFLGPLEARGGETLLSVLTPLPHSLWEIVRFPEWILCCRLSYMHASLFRDYICRSLSASLPEYQRIEQWCGISAAYVEMHKWADKSVAMCSSSHLLFPPWHRSTSLHRG